MDKIKLLVEKYKLPDNVAKDVAKHFEYAKLFEMPYPKKKPTTKANIATVDAVRKAEPDACTYFDGIPKMQYGILKVNDSIPFEENIKLRAQGWYSTNKIHLKNSLATDVTSPIESVTFRIDGKNYKLTDFRIIQRIRQLLLEPELQPMMNPAHGHKNPVVYYRTKAAILLFDSLPADMLVKTKEFTINDIFCLFIKTWQAPDVEKVRNYLRNKER